MDSTTPVFAILKDCVAYQVIQSSKQGPRTSKSKAKVSSTGQEESDVTLADELDEFVAFLAQEMMDALPPGLSSVEAAEDTSVDTQALIDSVQTPPTFLETLTTYSFSNSQDDAEDLFRSILRSYTTDLQYAAEEKAKASQPPAHGWKATRTEECEICGRDVPLTYHHLIPRSTHDKVLKRKWHPEEMLNVVAWLCRPCHTAVHRTAPNEVLAERYYSVELLMQLESLQKWAAYAGRQRWGVRRG